MNPISSRRKEPLTVKGGVKSSPWVRLASGEEHERKQGYQPQRAGTSARYALATPAEASRSALVSLGLTNIDTLMSVPDSRGYSMARNPLPARARSAA